MLPARQDLFAVFRRSIQLATLSRINPAVVDVAGSDLNLIAGAVSLMGEEVSAQLATCLQDQFADTAQADALDRLAGDRYGLTRLGATPATVDLTFTRLTFTAGSGVIPAGTRVQTASGTQFSTDVDLSIGGTQLVGTVTATALIVGPDSNVGPAQINAIVDAVFDTSFTVNNPSWSAGGTDVETDPNFRGRIRDFFASLRRGTVGAIEFGARQVAGVAVARAIEDLDFTGSPAGHVQLIIGDANGNATTDMIQAVENILIDWRAAGVPVDVLGGKVVFQPVVWSIAIDTGYNQQTVLQEVAAVTVAVSQFLRPGQILLRSTLIAAAHTVPGAVISDTSLQSPLADTVPIDNSTMIRIQTTGVSFT